MGENDETIGSLEAIEFNYIKRTADIIKNVLKQVDGVLLDGKKERLSSIKKDLEMALDNLKQFTITLNKENCVLDDIKETSKKILRKL